MAEKLSRQFYNRRRTQQIARELLGKVLVVPDENGRRVSGRIVETEAYLGAADKAAHAYQNRRTKRTEVLFGPGGHAYVFFIYGMYYQLNIVVGEREAPFCVLVRGIEPLEGIEIMRERRGAMKDKNLTSGPGKLCIAFGIDKTFYGEDLSGDRIWIEEGEQNAVGRIASGKRIGIDYAGEFAEKPWRYWIRGNPFVSK
ncbi:MAG: DNA-3-methyladenine glycosylase [Pyrinomonadaceae bacterium]